MNSSAQRVCDFFDAHNLQKSYEIVDDNQLLTKFPGENFDAIPILLTFDDTGDQVSLFSSGFYKAEQDQGVLNRALMLCNSANQNMQGALKGFKVYLDKELDYTVEANIFIRPQTAGSECTKYALAMGQFIDSFYDMIMKYS